MKIFNFELEEKLDHHFQVKFDGKSDGNSLKALKRYFNPLIGPNWPLIDQKIENVNIELEEKLEQHFQVKFDGEFDGNGLEALKLLNFEQLPRGFATPKLCFCE